MNVRTGERAHAHVAVGAHIVQAAEVLERLAAGHWRFDFAYLEPRDRNAVLELRRAIATERISLFEAHRHGGKLDASHLILLDRELAVLPHDVAWEASLVNTVVTGGADNLLTEYWTGSSYTAAWYLGLVSDTDFSEIAATDTMASHAGWTESTVYSASTRPAPTFGSAASRTISTSSAVSYSINGSDTIYGAFTTTDNTKSGTTGTLYSAGEFSGGTQPVSSGGTLQVSLSQSV